MFFFAKAAGFFIFLLHEQKKNGSKKKIRRLAFFCLLQHFSPLNKKNSLRSNSFLFLTLRKAPPLNGKKKRPELYVFFRTTSEATFNKDPQGTLKTSEATFSIHPLLILPA